MTYATRVAWGAGARELDGAEQQQLPGRAAVAHEPADAHDTLPGSPRSAPDAGATAVLAAPDGRPATDDVAATDGRPAADDVAAADGRRRPRAADASAQPAPRDAVAAGAADAAGAAADGVSADGVPADAGAAAGAADAAAGSADAGAAAAGGDARGAAGCAGGDPAVHCAQRQPPGRPAHDDHALDHTHRTGSSASLQTVLDGRSTGVESGPLPESTSVWLGLDLMPQRR